MALLSPSGENSSAPPAMEHVAERKYYSWLPFILAGTLGVLYALIMPAWSGPDEMAHMAYITALAQGHLPLVPPDRTANLLTGTTYQAQHPPFFYLLATPIYIVTGRNALVTLYILRLLGVATFLGALRLLQIWSRNLLSPNAACAATWLWALHPVTVYVASMVNNEILAIALGLGCLAAAERAARNEIISEQRKWLFIAVCCGALALMTKLTALCAVGAAAVFWMQRSSESLCKRGFIGALIVALCALPWWPWSWFLETYRHNVLPPIFSPVFTGGPMALIGYPETALHVAGMILVELSAGFVVPTWVLHDRANFSMYVIYGIGALVFLGLMAACRRYREFRFVLVGFFVLYALVVLQAWFRDYFAIITAARYFPAISAPVSLVAATIFEALSPRGRRLAKFFWITLVISMAILPFYSAFE